MTDHMMVATYHPVTGWSDPEIKPYGPFVLDPVSSCFQYSTNLFEGMKVCCTNNTLLSWNLGSRQRRRTLVQTARHDSSART